MRRTAPEVAEKRKKDLLQWTIHYYLRTSRPVPSAVIAEESGLDLSPARIRSLLQELDEEGYLHQPHTSAGRAPTDKGYRFFVDYLMDVQRLAEREKERIEKRYDEGLSELDSLLSETSRLLSKSSRAAGLALAVPLSSQGLKRLELVRLDSRHLLGVLVTESGLIRHWTISMENTPDAGRLATVNRFLAEAARGQPLAGVKAALSRKLAYMEAEFKNLLEAAKATMASLDHLSEEDSFYLSGTDNILERAEEIGDMRTVQALMRWVGEKESLAGLLRSEMEKAVAKASAPEQPNASAVRVCIGEEMGTPELAGLSLITTAYRHKGRPVGVLGILGTKRMAYPRMMSLLSYLGDLVSQKLEGWDEENS
jgi:heat-inducible transcriptional repressor